jgi:UDP-N-acetyl-D-glucosamine dehydrogenase
VGLPLAVAFAEAGTSVIGIDADSYKISDLEAGNSYIDDIPAEAIGTLVGAGQLHPTTDYATLKEADAVLICLPTPLDEHREPKLSIVTSGAEAVAENLRTGTLVVLESTTYPGTTREVLLPILERGKYQVGKDFHLAFSPERVDPGNPQYTRRNIPKVIGAMTPACAVRAEALYKRVTEEVHILSTPESAELSKLLENIFRGVNIALVNEFAILCNRMGVDTWEVIEAAKTKPFGFMPFYPGPGLGGHCIPVDPFYLSWRARAFDMNTEFIELAGRINTSMPYYALSRITAALNAGRKPVNGSRVLILGMSYKPNVGDLRESPALKILELLRGSGAEVAYHDPYIPWLPGHKVASTELTPQEIRWADCVVIATNHKAVNLRRVVDHASKIVDLRNAVREELGALPDNVDVL